MPIRFRAPSFARRLSLLAAAMSLTAGPVLATEVNLYTTREPKLIEPLLTAFTQDTGVKVNTVFVKDGLLERVRAEGAQSPADVLMTVGIGNLLDLVDGEVTQPVDSAALRTAIPANLRAADGQWFALSLRDRVAYVAKDLDIQASHYEELADPAGRGKSASAPASILTTPRSSPP